MSSCQSENSICNYVVQAVNLLFQDIGLIGQVDNLKVQYVNLFKTYQAGIWRQNNVASTWRPIDDDTTLFQGCVFAG